MFGVLAAGMIPLLRSMAHRYERDFAWVVAREREDDGPTTIFMGSDEPEFSDHWRKIYWKKKRQQEKRIEWAESTAALMFLSALLLPIVQLTLSVIDWTELQVPNLFGS